MILSIDAFAIPYHDPGRSLWEIYIHNDKGITRDPYTFIASVDPAEEISYYYGIPKNNVHLIAS